MKKFFFLILIVHCQLSIVYSQNVGIGTTSPNASAQLDVSSTAKGFLPPRMSAAQRKAIASPAAGLVVYDTDASSLYLYDGSAWQPLSTGSGSNSATPSQPALPAGELGQYKYYGSRVAMGDNYAVAGAPNSDSGSLAVAGAAFVYKKGTNGTWQVFQKLNAADAQAYAQFGSSVAIAGNYIIVSAIYHTVNANGLAGKVYVFSLVGNTWTQQASFTKPGTPAYGDNFGFAVAISTSSLFGPVFIASAPFAYGNANGSGAAYTFRLTGGVWSFEQTIIPPSLNVNERVGYSVDIDGDYFVAGSPYRDNSGSGFTAAGAVYVYVFGGGVWNQQTRLDGQVNMGSLGASVALKGSVLAAAAPHAVLSSTTAAGVVIYRRSGGTWGLDDYLTLSNQQGYDFNNYFGIGLDFDSTNTLLVGAPSGFYFPNGYSDRKYKTPVVVVYKLNALNHFYFAQLINDNDPVQDVNGSSLFGNSIGIKNGNYIIGIPDKTVNGYFNAGKVAFGYVE